MTTWNDVKDDKNFIQVLDHGFVGLVDHMGSDADIARSARVSYGKGTKTVRQDRGLIRYLVKHKHTSPIEMAEIKFHIKLPIFVMRQLVRHRTASLNEISARYSELPNEFYIPEIRNLKPQSEENNQGRAGEFSTEEAIAYRDMIAKSCEDSYAVYEKLIAPRENGLGVAREIARGVLPVNIYTEVYWKQDLKNLLHLIRLRIDPHAQWEIQQFAQAMYDLIQPLYPDVIEAFEDYERESTTISKSEKALLSAILKKNGSTVVEKLEDLKNDYSSEKDFLNEWGISKRELKDFMKSWENLI